MSRDPENPPLKHHPKIAALAVGLTIFIILVAPFLWAARILDDALRTGTPRPTGTPGWWRR